MKQRLALAVSGLGALLLPVSCSGGSGGGSSSQMALEESTNGFGRLLPYETFLVDGTGAPSTTVIEIRSMSDLLTNVNVNNPIHSVVEWPTTKTLPDGNPGNHFIHARFRQPIDVASCMTANAAAAFSSNLSGEILVIALDPSTGNETQIQGQAFVGGRTYGTTPDPADGTKVLLEQWVTPNGSALMVEHVDVNDDGIVDPGEMPGLGFPGTEQASPFNGAVDLLDPRSFVFIPDVDNDLKTYETFPPNVQIRLQITTGLRGVNGKFLQNPAVASSTVGADTVKPEVRTSSTGSGIDVVPETGAVNIDPQTSITVGFTEPVQILSVGDLDDGTPPGLSASILVQFGPTANLVTVPFTVTPRSIYDLTKMTLTPTYAFPGSGPAFPSCGAFNQVQIVVNPDQLQDLVGNTNDQQPQSFFATGSGPGLVNAPVTPDVIYARRIQADSSISVVDLNGFGAGTGNPTFDPTCVIKKGNTNFPNNPNVLLQGSALVPSLSPGGCTFNGGSTGPFSLALDSSLDDRLVRSPIVESVGDMMLGHALDTVFNNGAPFGCQAGGGNLCAQTGLKIVAIAAGGSTTLAPSTITTFPIKTEFGVENLVSWAPHPNPPPMVFPPLCLQPNIGGQEPTSTDTPPVITNLLVPGPIPLGNPSICSPPQFLLSPEQNTFFEGPSLPASDVTQCSNYMVRQQIGHFLYVLDRVASEVVVMNSNRMSVLDRIPVPDPTSLAISPDLDFLAVTNQNADSVSFISINPASSSFHQIVKTVAVGKGPTGITWESGNEDIFVCNQGENTLAIISAFNLEVRKTINNQLFGPFEVVTTPRQLGFGLFRGVYYAYILNLNGSVSLFESGPNGINGWGFDEVIGSPQFVFENPKAIQVDVVNLSSSIWVAHEKPLNITTGLQTGQSGGAVTNMFVESGTIGIIPLDTGFFGDPNLRDLEFSITASIGEGAFGLTGVPVDIAFDNHRNRTALTNFSTSFSAGFPLSVNGKSLVKPATGGFASTNSPQFMFLAVPTSNEGPGVIDVINLEGGFQRFDTDPFQLGNQSIPVPGIRGVMDYMRQ